MTIFKVFLYFFGNPVTFSDTDPKATFPHPPFSLLCDCPVFGARGGKIKVNMEGHKNNWEQESCLWFLKHKVIQGTLAGYEVGQID